MASWPSTNADEIERGGWAQTSEGQLMARRLEWEKVTKKAKPSLPLSDEREWITRDRAARWLDAVEQRRLLAKWISHRPRTGRKTYRSCP